MISFYQKILQTWNKVTSISQPPQLSKSSSYVTLLLQDLILIPIFDNRNKSGEYFCFYEKNLLPTNVGLW